MLRNDLLHKVPFDHRDTAQSEVNRRNLEGIIGHGCLHLVCIVAVVGVQKVLVVRVAPAGPDQGVRVPDGAVVLLGVPHGHFYDVHQLAFFRLVLDRRLEIGAVQLHEQGTVALVFAGVLGTERVYALEGVDIGGARITLITVY